MKNERTPRLMRDGQWSIGYYSAEDGMPSLTPIFVGAVSAIGSFALLAWMFAERFGWP